jgi:hypothetical protein
VTQDHLHLEPRFDRSKRIEDSPLIVCACQKRHAKEKAVTLAIPELCGFDKISALLRKRSGDSCHDPRRRSAGQFQDVLRL